MKIPIISIAIILTGSICFATDYTIRPNTMLGTPDKFQRGFVAEKGGNDSYTIRRETMPGSGQGNPFVKGKVITPNEDGSWRVQEEILPGSGRVNPWDNGYTIEEE